MDYNELYERAKKYDEKSAKYSLAAVTTKNLQERYKLFQKARLTHSISKSLFTLGEILQKEYETIPGVDTDD